MSHQEKQEIFDAYAISKGYEGWQDLLLYFAYHIVNSSSTDPDYALLNHFYSICDIVQKEQQKRIAEKFKSLVYSDQVDDLFIGDFEKMEASIINPENLIK